MDGLITVKDEYFEVVDNEGKIIDLALRSECHRNPSLIHRVSHVLIFNRKDLLLLQKRVMTKDIQPGKWDTSVGGHLAVGENFEEAAYREMKEELGIQNIRLLYLYQYMWRSKIETEMVCSFLGFFNGTIEYNPEEIVEVYFWKIYDLLKRINEDIFTPNLKEELFRYLRWKNQNKTTELL